MCSRTMILLCVVLRSPALPAQGNLVSQAAADTSVAAFTSGHYVYYHGQTDGGEEACAK